MFVLIIFLLQFSFIVDESLQLNFPDSTIGLALEDRTCDLVLDLLGIPPDTFAGRTITTGATASNIVGLGTSGRSFTRAFESRSSLIDY
jgi:hypothetical protein